jgi:hypothetical protein
VQAQEQKDESQRQQQPAAGRITAAANVSNNAAFPYARSGSEDMA